ncbi:MAG: type II secretion system F family protein [Candidatus Bilamarchaeaceae archaeon]
MSETIFEIVGRLVFSRERVRRLEKELNNAGINIPGDSFAGYVVIDVFVMAFFISIILMLLEPLSIPLTKTINSIIQLPSFVIWLLIFLVLLIIFYFVAFIILAAYLIMRVENRRNQLEAVLPDFLMLVSSNIKSGMTLDQAMWYAAKPEFGLLSEETKAVIKGTFSGQSLDKSLDTLAARFASKPFERTILLIKQANATGGELTSVLEKTADDVRESLIIKKEIAASLVMYEIFVIFASVIGTPFLFAVGGKLIEVFEKISIHMPSTTGFSQVYGTFSTVNLGAPVITASDFFWFSIPTIFVTCLISSFIVSAIKTGSRSSGMKYFPFMLFGAYVVYWIASTLLNSIFTTFS